MAYSDIFEKIIPKIIEVIFFEKITEKKLKEIPIKDIISHEILSKKKETLLDIYFDYYKLLMKKRVMNIFSMSARYTMENAFQNIKENVLPHMRLVAAFYGDISKDKAQNIFETKIVPKIDIYSVNLELSVKNILNEEAFMQYIHSQYYFKGSYILRFPTPKPKGYGDYFLVSNYFLLGKYNQELNYKVDLVIIIWKGLFPTLIGMKGNYYAYFNKYIYNGMILLNFVVQSVSEDPSSKEGMNYISDMAVGNLLKMVYSVKSKMYSAKDSLLANYWKNDTSIEERTSRIFNTLYLGLTNFEQGYVNKTTLESITNQTLIDFCQDVFINNVSKLSIQIFPYSAVYISDKSEEYALNNSIISKAVVNDINYISEIYSEEVHPGD